MKTGQKNPAETNIERNWKGKKRNKKTDRGTKKT
jgi:hypothetical protein